MAAFSGAAATVVDPCSLISPPTCGSRTVRAFGELMLIPWYGSAGTLSVRRDGAGQNGVHDYGARACAPGVPTVARLGEDDWQAWREIRWPRWLLLRARLVPPWNRKTSARMTGARCFATRPSSWQLPGESR